MTTQAPVNHAAGRREPESKTETYLRQIRNMLGWIMVLIGITIIAGIIAGATIAAHQGPQVGTSNCLTQGGTDTSC